MKNVILIGLALAVQSVAALIGSGGPVTATLIGQTAALDSCLYMNASASCLWNHAAFGTTVDWGVVGVEDPVVFRLDVSLPSPPGGIQQYFYPTPLGQNVQAKLTDLGSGEYKLAWEDLSTQKPIPGFDYDGDFDDHISIVKVHVSDVPEPGTAGIVGFVLLGAGLLLRRTKHPAKTGE
jgi:hypothetical protein